MTIEFVASPRKSESPAVMSNRIRMGLPNCRPRTAQPLAWWVRTAFGPTSAKRLAASATAQPVHAGAQLLQDLVQGESGGVGDGYRRGVRLLYVELWHAESIRKVQVTAQGTSSS